MRITTLVILAFAVLLPVGHAERSAYGGGGVVKVKLRDYVFHIPERNAMRRTAPFWLRWIKGLDDSSNVTRFRVPLEEVRRSIPAFRWDFRSSDDVTAILTVLSEEEVARYHDSYRFHGEMWYGTGSYTGRRVEPLGETGWYRVYHPLETKSWEVLRRRPDENTPLPDDPLSFYVARCSIRLGGETTGCLTYALSGRVVIDFWTQEENLLLVDEIRDFMIAKVLEWKQPS